MSILPKPSSSLRVRNRATGQGAVPLWAQTARRPAASTAASAGCHRFSRDNNATFGSCTEDVAALEGCSLASPNGEDIDQ
jgi:hypothetical protein